MEKYFKTLNIQFGVVAGPGLASVYSLIKTLSQFQIQ